MLINCAVPAINYSTCYHGEAYVLMRGNVDGMKSKRIARDELSTYTEI